MTARRTASERVLRSGTSASRPARSWRRFRIARPAARISGVWSSAVQATHSTSGFEMLWNFSRSSRFCCSLVHLCSRSWATNAGSERRPRSFSRTISEAPCSLYRSRARRFAPRARIVRPPGRECYEKCQFDVARPRRPSRFTVGVTCLPGIVWLSIPGSGTNLAFKGRTFSMKHHPDSSPRPPPSRAPRPRGRRGFSVDRDAGGRPDHRHHLRHRRRRDLEGLEAPEAPERRERRQGHLPAGLFRRCSAGTWSRCSCRWARSPPPAQFLPIFLIGDADTETGRSTSSRRRRPSRTRTSSSTSTTSS